VKSAFYWARHGFVSFAHRYDHNRERERSWNLRNASIKSILTKAVLCRTRFEYPVCS